MEEIKEPEKTGGSWGLNDEVVKMMIKKTIPSIIVDFGCGRGKYGKYCREILNYPFTIIGVDGYEPTIKWLRTQPFYNQVLLKDIIEATDIKGTLAIFGDCLEHLEIEDMYKTMRNAIKNFRWVIVVVPIGEHPQGISGGNELEIHKSILKEHDFDEFDIKEKHLVNAISKEGTYTKMALLIRGL